MNCITSTGQAQVVASEIGGFFALSPSTGSGRLRFLRSPLERHGKPEGEAKELSNNLGEAAFANADDVSRSQWEINFVARNYSPIDLNSALLDKPSPFADAFHKFSLREDCG